jgi:hypothetical protein
VVQLDPHALRLATPHCERGVPDPHDERIAAGTGLGEDLDLFTVHETELEKPTLEGGQWRGARANAHDRSPRARRQGRKAHEARRTAHSFRSGHSIHESSMDENGSHLQ